VKPRLRKKCLKSWAIKCLWSEKKLRLISRQFLRLSKKVRGNQTALLKKWWRSMKETKRWKSCLRKSTDRKLRLKKNLMRSKMVSWRLFNKKALRDKDSKTRLKNLLRKFPRRNYLRSMFLQGPKNNFNSFSKNKSKSPDSSFPISKRWKAR